MERGPSESTADASRDGNNTDTSVRLDALDSDASGRGNESLVPFGVAAAVLSACVIIHLIGVFGAMSYSVTIGIATIVGVIGLRWHKPAMTWPWWLLLSSGFLWSVGSAWGGSDANLGNLT